MANSEYFLDLFCGGGGASLGLKAAGFSSVGVDNNEAVIAAYRRNVGDCHEKDVTKMSPQCFGGVTGIFASPPCQQWSQSRCKQLSPRGDAEIGLVLVEWLRVLRPRYFILENVPGYRHSSSFKGTIQALVQLTYSYRYSIIDCSNYGIPQSRRRLFLWAVLGDVAPPLPLKVRQLGWRSHLQDLSLPSSQLTRRQKQAIFQGLDSGKFSSTGAIAIERCGQRSDRPPIIRREDEPIHTLRVGNCNRPTSINSVTFTRDSFLVNAFDIRALARLQSFPDSYSWSGSYEIDGRILGNSVPPQMVKMLVQQLRHT